MILSMVAAAAVLGSCATGEPLPRDPDAAQVYLDVGDEELARGDRAAARQAFREAVRLDPQSARAQAAWRSACADPAAALAQALREMQAGRCPEALRTLDALPPASRGGEAALLRGLCHYELGAWSAAREALEVARRDPASADTAALYLGLVALAEDRGGAAAAAIAPVLTTSDEETRAAASALLRVSRERSRLLLVAGVELLHDTNPYLIPQQIAPLGYADQAANAFAGALLRPFGVSGPYLRAAGAWRDLRQTQLFDTVQGVAAAGVQWGASATYLRAEYAFDGAWLGGAAYSQTHSAELIGGFATEAWGGTARYRGRLEQILPTAFAGYSGLRQEATAALERWFSGVGVSIAYDLDRADAMTSVLSYLEHGPRAQVRFGAGGPHAVRLHGRYRLRPFDRFDPELGVRREDRVLEAGITYDAELGPSLRLHLVGVGVVAQSNAAAFNFLRGAVTLGFSWTGAAW